MWTAARRAAAAAAPNCGWRPPRRLLTLEPGRGERTKTPVNRKVTGAVESSNTEDEGRGRFTTVAGPGDFRAVKLSFVAFESKSQADEEKKKSKCPLVVQHSLMGCKKNWRKVAKEIHHLTRRSVVTPDARNHGESPRTAEMSYSLMAKDMNFLLKHLNYKKVAFMGHSMGGRVGMILALTQPQLVDRLICVDSTPVNTPVSVDRWATLGRACRKLKKIESQIWEKEGIARAMMAEEILRPILPNARDRSLFLSNLLVTRDDAGKKDENKPLWRLNLDAVISNPQMAASFPSFSDVRFEGKVLFIAGDLSRFVKRDHEDDIRSLFPNVRFKWLPDCGHWIHADKHEEFLEETVKFLEES